MRYERRKGERSSGSGTSAIAFTVAALIVLALAARASAQATTATTLPTTITYATGQGGGVTGLIVARQGDDMLVRDQSTRALSTVTLTSDTKISSPSGVLKLDKKAQSVTSLIPGLIVAVKGSGGDRGNLVADKISFHQSALRVANQISAGEVELKAEQRMTDAKADANTDSIAEAKARGRDSIAAMNARVSDLDSYDVKYTGTVLFATGSAALGSEAKSTLDDMVAQGQGLSGYMIEVAGFADATGSAALNQRLSDQRADAVVAYLTQMHSVPLRRILTPAGLSTSHAAATNDTPDGRAQNRRVEVKVLINRGLRPPGQP